MNDQAWKLPITTLVIGVKALADPCCYGLVCILSYLDETLTGCDVEKPNCEKLAESVIKSSNQQC